MPATIDRSSMSTSNCPRRASLRRSQLQSAALERLIRVLQAAAERQPSVETVRDSSQPLNQQARLRAAHAAYALRSGTMQRIDINAWCNTDQ